MGWEQVANTNSYNLRNLSAGWFPGRSYNDIPGSIDGSDAIGSPNCNNSIWYDGALRKIFGYDNTNTVALNGGAATTSCYYSPTLATWVGTVGNKLYSGIDVAVPTDITGAVTITAGNKYKWTDYIFSTTIKEIIGTNLADPPIKWTGTGNAAVLGGSPPQGQWCTTWQNSLWIASTATALSTLYFSALGDPETWSASDNYNFDSPITGIEPLGDKLVVFMSDHIGILQGTNNRILTKIERYITNIGCTSGYSISPCKIQGRDALVFHSADGFYIFDGSTKVTKISSCIQNKYIGSSDVEKFNANQFSSICGAYFPSFDWYISGMASGADTTNLFGMIIDMGTPMQLESDVVMPHWPMDPVANAISCIGSNQTADANSSCIFGSTNGFFYKFNISLFNQNGSAIQSFWESKIFDMTYQSIIQEVNVLSKAQNSLSELTVFTDGDLGIGGGIPGTADFADVGDQLDIDFFIGTSALANETLGFKNIATGNFGRFISFKLQNLNLDQEMVVNLLNCVITNISLDSNVGN